MNDQKNIIQFIEEFWGEAATLTSGSCVFCQLGIDGDDAFDFMEQYAEKFDVNLDNYRWYFHSGEEGWGFGAVFFKPPYARVEHLPLTVNMLVQSASKGRWCLAYPEHTLPARRYDLLINQIVVLFLLVLILWFLVISWL